MNTDILQEFGSQVGIEIADGFTQTNVGDIQGIDSELRVGYERSILGIINKFDILEQVDFIVA